SARHGQTGFRRRIQESCNGAAPTRVAEKGVIFMKRVILGGALALSAVCGLLAQKPKSQKEVEALQAVFKTTTADERIAAAQNVLIKFADTEFKPLMLLTIAQAYQMKGDTDNVIIFAEHVLKEGDPKNYEAMLMLAE